MKTLRTLILMMLILQCTAYAYEGSDNSDRLSSTSSSVFSPGYINAAKQKTEAITNQMYPQKSFMERLVENIKGGVANNVDEAADTKVVADVKKKTSLNASTKTDDTAKYAIAPEGSVIIGYGTKIDIGSGALKHYEDGRMVSEYINGVKHIYVGFENVGFRTDGSKNPIQYAIDQASANDVIIVKGGSGISYLGDINISRTVHIYGGFDETGQRNIITNSTNISGTTTIGDAVGVELNGLSMERTNFQGNSPTNLLYCSSKKWCVNDVEAGAIQFIGDDYGTGRGSFLGWKQSWGSITWLLGPQSSYLSFSKAGMLGDAQSGYQISTIGSPVRQVLLENRSDSSNSGQQMSSLYSDYWRNMSDFNKFGSYGSSPYESFNRLSGNPLAKDATSGIFKDLLALNDSLSAGDGGGLNKELISRLVRDSLGAQSLSQPLTDQEMADQMSIALALANILKNPTEDQKLVIDAITSLLKDIANAEGDGGKSNELTKAENDLLQMAAAVLLAQGIPDLLKEGDVENMKGMFKDLGASKDKVLLDYKDSIKPYYNNIAKEIAANIAVLEIKGIVNKKLTEEELRKMEPREIDRILESIRKSNDKSFELEYILQQDSKYRKEYLNPSKKLMEDHMKLILGSFAKKLSDALEDKK